jgi:hypothetical protein
MYIPLMSENVRKVSNTEYVIFRDMLATGCDDKRVRIYYLATATDQPLKIFSGKTVNGIQSLIILNHCDVFKMGLVKKKKYFFIL